MADHWGAISMLTLLATILLTLLIRDWIALYREAVRRVGE